MPHALIALPDVYESVIRRVAVDSVSQLARIMRLPPDTQIRLPGYAETLPMNNGMFKPCDDPGITYPIGGRLNVTFQEETMEDHTLITPVNTTDHMPLFWDEVRDISVRPVYRTVRLTLNLEYVADNQNVAQRWLDEMRSRVSMLRAELYQSLEYHYAIPTSVMTLLHHLHETKEASQLPDGDDFDTYLEAHLLRPTTVAETLVSTHPTRVIKENQLEVLGWFDFTDSPQPPEKDSNESGAFRCNVSYSFQYDRPMQMFCRYPMVVHNKPIARTYRSQEPYETFRRRDRRVSFVKDSFDSLMENMRRHGIPYIQYPDTDDWIPDRKPKDSLTVFTGLLMIKPDHPRRVVNLFNLGPYTFTPYFLEYFYKQRHTLFGDRSSPFEFRLYQSGRHMTEVELSFEDNSVTIQTDQDLDLTYQYHIQIALRRNWQLLDRPTIQCLRRYPVVTYLTLAALGVRLGGGDLDDVALLGGNTPRPASTECPGEGSLIGPPETGGTWPWPWLGEEWDYTPWPGYKWPAGEGPENPAYFPPGTWPGGGHVGVAPPIPTGGSYPPGYPGTYPNIPASDGGSSPGTDPSIPMPGGTSSNTYPTTGPVAQYPTWPGEAWPPNVGGGVETPPGSGIMEGWPPGPGPGGTWPPGTWPGGGSLGTIRDKDIKAAVEKTANVASLPVDRTQIGPLNILYLEILTQLRS